MWMDVSGEKHGRGVGKPEGVWVMKLGNERGMVVFFDDVRKGRVWMASGLPDCKWRLGEVGRD